MKITNNTSRDMSVLTKTLESFIPYAQKRLEYDKPFQIVFESDEENAKNIFGKTAYYDPATMNVHIYSDGRHDKDMLRSISHEMVHHAQNCRGDFEGAFEMGEGYAQKSPHLRNMEAEAYLLGNGFLVRDFEDHIKMGDNIVNEWKKEKKKKKKVLNEKVSISVIPKLIQRLMKKDPAAAELLKQAAELAPAQLGVAMAEVNAELLGVTPEKFVKAAGGAKSALQKKEKLKAKKQAEAPVAAPAEPIKEKSQELDVDAEAAVVVEIEGDETVKDHYRTKNEKLYEELMKRFIRK